MSERSRTVRRGMVLVGVLLVVAMAALAGTTAMYIAQAQGAAARTELKRVQSRALAWSGVQAVMAELSDQREGLLDGGDPELTREVEVYAEESGVRGIVRLVPWGEDGPLAMSETAKLDVNRATVEMLKKVGMDDASAAAVVAGRGKGKFASVGDLARVKDVAAAMLAAGEGEEDAVADGLTVFSFDPNVQAGLGDGGANHRGTVRLNVKTQWSERLGAALDERFGDGAGAMMKRLFDSGTKFESLGDLAKAAQRTGLPATAWAPVFDALTVTDDPYLTGVVDVNRASERVLAAVPGISAEAAAGIVRARETLDQASRRSVCWPVTEGLLKTEEFAEAVDYLTTRSMQWRVRVEAGLAPKQEAGDREEAVLSDRIVLEVVVDVASERPRVAYLRDVTLEGAMAAVYAERGGEMEQEEEGAIVEDAKPSPELVPKLDLGTDLDLGGMAPTPDLKLTETPQQGPIQPSAEGAGTPGAPPAREPGKDRRVGRWTTGGGG